MSKIKDENEIKNAENTVDKEKILKQFESGKIKVALTEEQAKRLYDGLRIEQSRAEYDFIRNALEKQIPKKPIETTQKGISLWHAEEVTVEIDLCPRCRKKVCENYEVIDDDFCSGCGQRLDWGNEK